jgi:hypothetical protein
MLETGGRPIFRVPDAAAGERLFGHPDDRLPRLLEESRRYQTEVSPRWRNRCWKACKLPAAFTPPTCAPGPRASSISMARPGPRLRRPADGYDAAGFRAYAEHRGLFPDDTVWAQNYALAGLYERLRDDAALHPGTMDDRYGAWPQLLALFHIVHSGAAHGARLRLVARRGRLFDPDRFPFLEGRDAAGDKPAPPRVSDGWSGASCNG